MLELEKIIKNEKNFSAPKNFATVSDLFLFLVKNIYLVVQHILVL